MVGCILCLSSLYEVLDPQMMPPSILNLVDEGMVNQILVSQQHVDGGEDDFPLYLYFFFCNFNLGRNSDRLCHRLFSPCIIHTSRCIHHVRIVTMHFHFLI